MKQLTTFQIAVLAAVLSSGSIATAQITTPQMLSIRQDRYATLEDQLINRLHATTEQQRAYLRYVVKQVEAGKLELRLVVAVERYALRRNPRFPLPFFERAMKVQAAKEGVPLPALQTFVTTQVPHP
ncbi:hypothetical protein [Novipirellula artificiosorum]|uniref:Uncharacterized protein n=1 Tax=Novipirellula artificiosorum TaxID=2528016 RepID=A0A5C6DEF4_9BACT|nr:hypothetical protein [Novipirellula artificiosorum]TWU35180.1 hypothetical protein Poly41_43290 [Novipirellula artificiosorum]